MNTPRPIVLGDNVCYGLRLEDGGVLLVDAGPDFEEARTGDTWAQAVQQAGAHGFAPPDVRFVIVTHGHIDHAGLAARWAAEGARIVVGAADRAALLGGRASNEAQRALRLAELQRHGCPASVVDRLARLRGTLGLRWPPCPSEALLTAEEVPPFRLAGGGALQLIAAPGHTPGNIVGWEARRGDLYSGDTLLPTTIPTPGLHFPAALEGAIEGSAPSDSVPRWPSLPPFLRSVASLSRLPVRRVLPGHGEVVEEPSRLFQRFSTHHQRRAERIRHALPSARRGADVPAYVTAYELVRTLFPRLPPERVGQAMTEAIGHLDVLHEAGAVEVIEQVEDPARIGGTQGAEAATGSRYVRRYRLRNEGDDQRPSVG